MPLRLWKVGGALIVGQPTEGYSEMQVELRRQFPDTPVCARSLVNGCIAYQPPAGMYGTDVYPVWQSPFAEGNMELTIEAFSQEMRKQLTA